MEKEEYRRKWNKKYQSFVKSVEDKTNSVEEMAFKRLKQYSPKHSHSKQSNSPSECLACVRLRDEREIVFKENQRLHMILKKMMIKPELQLKSVPSVIVLKRGKTKPNLKKLRIDNCILFTKVLPFEMKVQKDRIRKLKIQSNLSKEWTLDFLKEIKRKKKIRPIKKKIQMLPLWGIEIKNSYEIKKIKNKSFDLSKSLTNSMMEYWFKKRIKVNNWKIYSFNQKYSYKPHNLFGPNYIKERELKKINSLNKKTFRNINFSIEQIQQFEKPFKNQSKFYGSVELQSNVCLSSLQKSIQLHTSNKNLFLNKTNEKEIESFHNSFISKKTNKEKILLESNLKREQSFQNLLKLNSEKNDSSIKNNTSLINMQTSLLLKNQNLKEEQNDKLSQSQQSLSNCKDSEKSYQVDIQKKKDMFQSRILALLKENTTLKKKVFELSKVQREIIESEKTETQVMNSDLFKKKDDVIGMEVFENEDPLDSMLILRSNFETFENYSFLKPTILKENKNRDKTNDEIQTKISKNKLNLFQEKIEKKISTNYVMDFSMTESFKYSLKKPREKHKTMNLFGSDLKLKKIKSQEKETKFSFVKKAYTQKQNSLFDQKKTPSLNSLIINFDQTMENVQLNSQKSLVSSLKKQLTSLKNENQKIRRVCKRIKKKKDFYRKKLKIFEKEMIEVTEDYEEEIICLRTQLKIFSIKKAMYFTHLFENNMSENLVKAKEIFN